MAIRLSGSDPGFASRITSGPGIVNPVRSDRIRSHPGFVNGSGFGSGTARPLEKVTFNMDCYHEVYTQIWLPITLVTNGYFKIRNPLGDWNQALQCAACG